MNQKTIAFMSWLPFLFLLPFFLAVLINGMDTAVSEHLPDLEDCLPTLLSLQIPDDYEPETLKAQAVIARTNLYRTIQEKKIVSILKTLQNVWKQNGKLFRLSRYKCFFPSDVYAKAVGETSTQTLHNHQTLPLVPYHQISSGETRDGREVFHDDKFEYLVSVNSTQDMKSPEYEKKYVFSKNELPSGLKVHTVDSQGHVLLLQNGDRLMDGETFRVELRLPSSHFTVKERTDSYLIICRGCGHGIGFSQYGANELAKTGKTYQELLSYYYPMLQIA